MDTHSRELQRRVNDSTTEINDLRKALEDSRRDALTNGLTGVANRKCFDQELHAATEDSRTSGEPLSLILADLDHFKNFNDTHGHQFGDQVLRLVGLTLHDFVKGKGTAARYGARNSRSFSLKPPAAARPPLPRIFAKPSHQRVWSRKDRTKR